MSRGKDYYLKRWLDATADSTNTKVILARYEAIKLSLAIRGYLPTGFSADDSKLTAESEASDKEPGKESDKQLWMPEL